MLSYRFYRFITFPLRWISLKFRNKDDFFIIHEKLGRPTENRPKGDLVWVHSQDPARAGEVVRAVAAAMPGKIILLTYDVVSAARPDHFFGTICQFAPIDNRLAVRNFLKFWEPSIAVYVGGELRPIQQHMLKKSDIPCFMVNGAISDKSYRRWKWAKPLARKTMRNFTFVWAVDNVQTLRLANLGARDIKSQELIAGPGKMREIMIKIKQAI